MIEFNKILLGDILTDGLFVRFESPLISDDGRVATVGLLMVSTGVVGVIRPTELGDFGSGSWIRTVGLLSGDNDKDGRSGFIIEFNDIGDLGGVGDLFLKWSEGNGVLDPKDSSGVGDFFITSGLLSFKSGNGDRLISLNSGESLGKLLDDWLGEIDFE